MRPFVRRIKSQLRARPAFPVEAWGGDERRVEFARWLSRTINQEANWPNDHFHPDDLVRLLCFVCDPLGAVETIWIIEDEIGSKLSDADRDGLTDMTLGEAVDFLLAFPLIADAP